MRTFLTILGVLAGLNSLIAYFAAFPNGSDIQLIASAAFGTMTAVCFGFASTLAKLETPKKETAADLARELLAKWDTTDQPTRDRLARSIILKSGNTASGQDLSALDSMELRSQLTSLIR